MSKWTRKACVKCKSDINVIAIAWMNCVQVDEGQAGASHSLLGHRTLSSTRTCKHGALQKPPDATQLAGQVWVRSAHSSWALDPLPGA